MKPMSLIKPTPWDTAVFGLSTYELSEYSETALKLASQMPGHHTIKVDPLADKKLLHAHGFYYCDTLVEPHCNTARLRPALHMNATISRAVDAAQVLAICHNGFTHGRFHRDFNLSKPAADLRYDNWLKQLLDANQVYGLYWQDALAGFIGHSDNSLVLHAVAESYRGRGLSKFWWSAVCEELLATGQDRVKSSISATNMAAVNLYSSLGFWFNNPKDIYHRLVP
ncbi:MAG TPA: GNAT family N-acetyltransferase [Desulfatirhabdiaceae bacterium]|nr:GNAT family N-acetyltransferase [Desulfatirhabdiaceae bacterium]